MPLDVLALQFLYGKNSTGTSLTDDSKSLSNYQKTTFTSDWLGMETLSSTSDGLDIDLSSVSASNIVDLRAGAFSSINIKEASYNSSIGSVKSPQTFYNINNVGLSYDASVSNLIGGSGNDVVYVGSNDVTIDGGGGVDKVYLYGSSANWTSTKINDTEIDFQNGDVAVKLKNIKNVAYYDMSSTSTLHARVDLTA
jgi:serralysin